MEHGVHGLHSAMSHFDFPLATALRDMAPTSSLSRALNIRHNIIANWTCIASEDGFHIMVTETRGTAYLGGYT